MEYVLAGVILLLLEMAYLKAAVKLRIFDVPHHQSSHTGIVVRGGGIIFYLAYLMWFVLNGIPYPMIFVGLSILALVSFMDDIHSISPKIRLVCQFAAFIIMLHETHVFTLQLPYILILSVVCVAAVNIYNFMDGINGITGGYSLVVLLALTFVNECMIEFIDRRLLVTVLMAVGVFCLFNFRRQAKCFAGDVGSLSIGYIVIFLLLKLMFKTGHTYWIAFISVYLVDGGLTILHRVLLQENLMTPHKKHAFQIMANELGMPHLKVTGIYMGLQAVGCLWFILSPGNATLIIQFFLLTMLYLMFMKKYYHLHGKKD